MCVHRYPGPPLPWSSGLVETVPTSQQDALALVQRLKAQRWSDRLTRAIIVELTVYGIAPDSVMHATSISQYSPFPTTFML